MKQSTTRSARLISRAARLLYSGNMPATPTTGRARSRWPAFRWQFAHETLPPVNRAASRGVSTKMRYPNLICSDSFAQPAIGSLSGSCGICHAVTIVVLAAISGFGGVFDREQPAADTAATTIAHSALLTRTIVLPDTGACSLDCIGDSAADISR